MLSGKYTSTRSTGSGRSNRPLWKNWDVTSGGNNWGSSTTTKPPTPHSPSSTSKPDRAKVRSMPGRREPKPTTSSQIKKGITTICDACRNTLARGFSTNACWGNSQPSNNPKGSISRH